MKKRTPKNTPPHFYPLLCIAVIIVLCGCRPNMFLSTPNTNTPLQDDSFLLSGRVSSADTVAVEVFYVRCPYGDSMLNTDLWKDVDEQAFSPKLRRALAANGIRVGLIGNQLPSSFLQILKSRDDENPNQIVTTIRLGEMSDTPHLMRKTISARNGQRNEINVSDIKSEATVLFTEGGTLGGETFTQSQGVLVIRTQTCGDGSVNVEMSPEVQYGQARQTFSYDAGSVTMETARPKRTFDSLRSSVNMKPGQVVVMTCVPDTGTNIGSFFFTGDETEAPYQKLLCLRILQTQHNDMYTQDGVLPMDPTEYSASSAKNFASDEDSDTGVPDSAKESDSDSGSDSESGSVPVSD